MNEIAAITAAATHHERWTTELSDPARRHRRHAPRRRRVWRSRQA